MKLVLRGVNRSEGMFTAARSYKVGNLKLSSVEYPLKNGNMTLLFYGAAACVMISLTA